jgi:hypothetical protein
MKFIIRIIDIDVSIFIFLNVIFLKKSNYIFINLFLTKSIKLY